MCSYPNGEPLTFAAPGSHVAIHLDSDGELLLCDRQKASKEATAGITSRSIERVPIGGILTRANSAADLCGAPLFVVVEVTGNTEAILSESELRDRACVLCGAGGCSTGHVVQRLRKGPDKFWLPVFIDSRKNELVPVPRAEVGFVPVLLGLELSKDRHWLQGRIIALCSAGAINRRLAAWEHSIPHAGSGDGGVRSEAPGWEQLEADALSYLGRKNPMFTQTLRGDVEWEGTLRLTRMITADLLTNYAAAEHLLSLDASRDQVVQRAPGKQFTLLNQLRPYPALLHKALEALDPTISVPTHPEITFTSILVAVAHCCTAGQAAQNAPFFKWAEDHGLQRRLKHTLTDIEDHHGAVRRVQLRPSVFNKAAAKAVLSAGVMPPWALLHLALDLPVFHTVNCQISMSEHCAATVHRWIGLGAAKVEAVAHLSIYSAAMRYLVQHAVCHSPALRHLPHRTVCSIFSFLGLA